MNFFEHQDRARRSTFWLVVLFALAVIAIITAVNVAVFGIATLVGDYHRRGPSAGGYRSGSDYPFAPHRPEDRAAAEIPPWELFAAVTGATLVVIIGGSLYKIAQLSRGGHAIAQIMGGRLITGNATEARDKQLLNVVEEMSIASGFPVPGVYVLEGEPAINAFAAGFTPADSVITVTRGTIDNLSRDELQGVVAHEYSHLLNGDTRLNLRLVGMLHGILVIGLIGYALIRSLQYVRWSSSSGSSRSDRDKGNGGIIIAILLLGVSLLIIGYVGMFFANLIQAAVCRAREFLADASAVQFTRNPGGIEDALKKIGGAGGAGGAGRGDEEAGSHVDNPQALQVAHMFFAEAVRASFARLMATHPPLEDRIRAIDANWDGRFIDTAAAQPASTDRGEAFADAAGFGFAPPRAVPVAARAEDIVHRVGTPTPQHVRYAAALLDEMPADLRQAAREPFAARAILFCLLLAPDADAARQQLDLLRSEVDATTLSTTLSFLDRIRELGERARLPLVDLCTPALRHLSAPQLQQFKQNLRTLIYADQQVTPAEFVLFKIIDQTVRPPDEPVRRAIPRYAALRPVSNDVAMLLSALALAGNEGDAAQAAKEYAAGVARLGNDLSMPPMLPHVDLTALDQALGRLTECTPGVKRRIIDAAAYCVATDGVVEVAEAELLRAVAATLDCPLPPIVSPPAPAAVDQADRVAAGPQVRA